MCVTNLETPRLKGIFFQAEDGIRDRSPSRGLGDVYKRQLSPRVVNVNLWEAVSYTHLTLPTIYSV